MINFTLSFSGGRLFGTRDASPLLLAPGVRLGKRFMSPSHRSQVHGVRHPAHDVVRLSENISGYVACVCLTQLDSSIELTVPAKICQTTSEHLHTNCTFTANLSTLLIDTTEIGKDRFMICLHKERKGLGLPATRRSVVIYHISSFCNWCLIWVNQMLIFIWLTNWRIQ